MAFGRQNFGLLFVHCLAAVEPPATQPVLQDAGRAEAADVVLRVKCDLGAQPFVETLDKVTFRVLAVYKGTDQKTGHGSMEKGGEFWLVYPKKTGAIEAGEMTVYVHLKTEMMRAGMGPVRTAVSPELLKNSATEGVSHYVRAVPATQPAVPRAGEQE